MEKKVIPKEEWSNGIKLFKVTKGIIKVFWVINLSINGGEKLKKVLPMRGMVEWNQIPKVNQPIIHQ